MKILARIACAVLLGAPLFSHAATVQLDARALLANPGFTVVDLKEDNGRGIGQLDRATVQRVVDVAGRLAKAFSMREPEVAIDAVASPDASVELRGVVPRVRISVGMLELVGGNDNGVAAVLAHAMAHVQAGHRNADFSRAQESEADALAVRAMADAGYNPRAEAAFWKVMDTRPKAWWNDSHRPYAERDADLAAAVSALGARR
jgi:predicted Zn-dependent protease